MIPARFLAAPALVGLALLLRGWAVAAAGVAAPPEPDADSCAPFAFRDVAGEAGIDFTHATGAGGAKHLPETMGAGVTWLDWDGDGLVDLYLVQSGPFPPDGSAAAANRLFRNLGGGRFAEVAGAAGASGVTGSGFGPGYGQGATAADVDGDGDSDLYVTNFGSDALYENLGNGRFRDSTVDSGLGLDGWSSSAAFADADSDGDLDLYVTRYVEYDPETPIFCGDPATGERRYCDPSLFLGAADRFYRNRGNGTFEDATAEAGFAGADGRGLGVVFIDLDGDRRPDLYVANDLTLNLLFLNLGGGHFDDVSLVSGAAVNAEGKPEAGMGIAVGDLDGDLDPDLLVTNFDVETNTLYKNLGGMAFLDVSTAAGFGLPSFNRLGFGIAAEDFDGDGDLDVYVANGHIFERPLRDNVSWREPDQLFEGDGRGGFVERLCNVLAERPTVARGLAAADPDGDLDPDLAVTESGGPVRLLENRAAGGSRLGVRLVGASANTEGVGARILLATGSGQAARWVTAGESYQSSSDRRARFGLAAMTAPEALEVAWPSGRTTRILSPAVDAYLTVFESAGSVPAPPGVR